MTSYRFSRWQPRRRKATFGFVLGDIILVRRPKSIYKPNFIQFTADSRKQTSAILELFFRSQFRPYHRNRHFVLHRSTKFHPDEATGGGVMMSYQFSRWRPLRRNFTSGFVLGDVGLFRRPMSMSKPNFVGNAQSTADRDITVSCLEK